MASEKFDARREELHKILTAITNHVYFQPPENVKIEYPCIIYRRSTANTQHADNKPYVFARFYQLTIIDKDPDSELVAKVAQLPTAAFDRHYTFENLNHDVFVIYY